MDDTDLPTAPGVSALTRGLAACLASVTEVPVAELPLPPGNLSSAVGAFRTWLAGRDSGLVPIADPMRFQWPGWWIAVVRTADTDVATVAFGIPPGIVLSPQDPTQLGRVTAELPSTAAYAVASLDPVLRPVAATPDLHGTVEALAIEPAAEAEMQVLEVAGAVTGRGLEGDRYAARADTFTPRGDKRPGYDLTTHTASGRAGENRRCTSSAAPRAPGSAMVVRCRRPRRTPSRSSWRINRSTVHRATGTPLRLSASQALRAP